MGKRLGEGAIGISVGGTYELAEAADALDMAIGGASGSAVVLRI
jgi:hypothetical protein